MNAQKSSEVQGNVLTCRMNFTTHQVCELNKLKTTKSYLSEYIHNLEFTAIRTDLYWNIRIVSDKIAT